MSEFKRIREPNLQEKLKNSNAYHDWDWGKLDPVVIGQIQGGRRGDYPGLQQGEPRTPPSWPLRGSPRPLESGLNLITEAAVATAHFERAILKQCGGTWLHLPQWQLCATIFVPMGQSAKLHYGIPWNTASLPDAVAWMHQTTRLGLLRMQPHNLSHWQEWIRPWGCVPGFLKTQPHHLPQSHEGSKSWGCILEFFRMQPHHLPHWGNWNRP